MHRRAGWSQRCIVDAARFGHTSVTTGSLNTSYDTAGFVATCNANDVAPPDRLEKHRARVRPGLIPNMGAIGGEIAVQQCDTATAPHIA